MEVSKTVLEMERSGIREIMDLALELDNVIRLEIGEPLFKTPKHIIEGAQNALLNGFTKYTPNLGIYELRKAVAEHINGKYITKISPSNVAITHGAMGGIITTLRSITEAGDHILLPNPGWPNYKMASIWNYLEPYYYPLNKDNNYKIDINTLESIITNKTKVLLVNSPSNPLGIIYNKDEINEIVDFAKKHDLFLVSDEVYDEIIFQGAHTSFYPHNDDGRIISIFSFSKTFSMTGFRIGYTVADELIIREIGKLQECSISSASSISQHAALSAFKNYKEIDSSMLEYYLSNLNLATEYLKKQKVRFLQPEGAFYLWIYINGKKSMEFAKTLLKREKVSVAPGITFGTEGEGYIRISLASSRIHLIEGLEKIVYLLNEN